MNALHNWWWWLHRTHIIRKKISGGKVFSWLMTGRSHLLSERIAQSPPWPTVACPKVSPSSLSITEAFHTINLSNQILSPDAIHCSTKQKWDPLIRLREKNENPQRLSLHFFSFWTIPTLQIWIQITNTHEYTNTQIQICTQIQVYKYKTKIQICSRKSNISGKQRCMIIKERRIIIQKQNT